MKNISDTLIKIIQQIYTPAGMEITRAPTPKLESLEYDALLIKNQLLYPLSHLSTGDELYAVLLSLGI